MHCRCCDTMLTDFEATRKNANTFEFVDLCNACFNDVKHIIPVIERKDLMTIDDTDTEAIEGFDDYEDIKDIVNYKYL